MQTAHPLEVARDLFYAALDRIAEKNYEQARDLLQQALSQTPDQLSLLVNYSAVLIALERHEEVIPVARRITGLDPHNVDGWLNLGVALEELAQPEAAREAFMRALAVNAGCLMAHVGMFRVLTTLGRFEQAAPHAQRAMELGVDDAKLCNNMGNLFMDLNDPAEAARLYRKSLALQPDDAHVCRNLAFAELLAGDFAAGWQHYEARLTTSPDDRRPHLQGREWTGTESVAGKRLLLYWEQGLGDTLQFARFVPRLKSLGATVILAVQPALVPLLRSLEGVDEVVGYTHTAERGLPHHDFYCALLSLPRLFRITTAAISAAGTPYLSVPEFYHAKWANALPSFGKTRIGIAWSGYAGNVNDHRRSMRLQDLAPLFSLDADFYVVQTEIRKEDRALLGSHANVLDLSRGLLDFADTAAVLQQLDMVVSVDTSLVHLAGALDLPVKVLLNYVPEWRWQLAREDSPWYRSCRLYRQTVRNDWGDAVSALMHDVAESIASRERAGLRLPGGARFLQNMQLPEWLRRY